MKSTKSSLPMAPTGELKFRTIGMPADTNAHGDMFGGWMMSQMDLAGASFAVEISKGPVVTIAVDGMTFHLPVEVGDEVSCYASLVRIGKTSIAVKVEAWARRQLHAELELVTQGTFTYVAIDDNRQPRQVKK
ncbi:MAG: acyl-CoA thioesterase [Dongiaceae bacterium]